MSSKSNRRQFLRAGAAAAAAGGVLLNPSPVHAAGSDVLKIGLVGTGGRGCGAAVNALAADPNVKLVSLCDIFGDRLASGLKEIKKTAEDEDKQHGTNLASRIDVKPEMQFTGFDGYKQLIDSGVDVVLLCSTPGFRPTHLKYAVEKKKHIFMEKPHATDVAGLRSVLESVKKTVENKTCLVSGFCYRYDTFKREAMKRLRDKVIGDITAVHTTYLTGELWHRGASPKWSEMEQQIRNWYYYTWLSGDFIVEQNIHSIDKAAWIMGGPPVAVTGTGGRQARTDAKWGNIWDNFSVVFEYANGGRVFNQCRQTAGCYNDNNDYVIGTKGTCNFMKHEITSEGKTWKHPGKHVFSKMYQTEHDELFAAIRKGEIINDGEQSANTTLMAIMAREAAYTGQRITWNQILKAKHNITPDEMKFGKLETAEVPVPGFYKLEFGKV